jgi:hypothetical protein
MPKPLAGEQYSHAKLPLKRMETSRSFLETNGWFLETSHWFPETSD